MGCDIHGYLELRRSSREDAYWWTVCSIPDDRTYDLFGILAGVRNYVHAIPISKPKGLPVKPSFTAKEDIERWDADGHSHSWLTWNEIKEYDWDQESQDGRISTIDLATGKEVSKASYTGLQDLSEEEVRERGFELKFLTRTTKELVPFMWRGFFEFMRHIAEGDGEAKGYGGENVRIVFWFDN